MSATKELISPAAPPTLAEWRGLYRLAGVAALLVVAIGLLDTLLSMSPGGAPPNPGQGTVQDWFALLQTNAFLGLRGLGLFNILNQLLAIPLCLAVCAAHARAERLYAALALTLAVAGLAIYAANNPALPLLGLSQKYAAAAEAQRPAIAAAGEALLVRGEDFTPGAFGGFFLSEAASLLVAWTMLRGGVFGRGTGYVGLAGMGVMVIFTLWATWVPVYYGAAMMFAMVGGLLSLAWYVLAARSLFQLSRARS